MICNHCEGSGFLNLDQLPEPEFNRIVIWRISLLEDNDIAVCDCCGDGKVWYGDPGFHNESDFGNGGPYEYNGGLPECY